MGTPEVGPGIGTGDLPLNFHLMTIRASTDFTPCGVVEQRAINSGSECDANGSNGDARGEIVARPEFHLTAVEQAAHGQAGTDITVAELAAEIARVTGFHGSIEWDTSKPDGTMLKRMDVSRLADMGWRARISFHHGLEQTFRWFLEQETLRN